MKMFMYFTPCIRSTRRLAKATGLSLGLAMAANGVTDPAKITSQPSDVSAEAGSATSLAGGNQYVSVPIDVPETECTVEFWFRTEDPNAGLFCVVDANLGGGGHDRHLHLTGGNIRVRTYSGPGVEVSEGLNLADGKWHHIAHVISYELGGQFVYVDGELVIEGVKDMSDFDWQQHINIGFSNDAVNQYLNGQID